MTERGAPASATARAEARPRARRKPSAFGIAVLTLGAFFAILALLASRMAHGLDPALGASASGASKRPVVVRRIEVLRVVEHPAPAAGAPASTSGTGAVPAAAPAPAPAPVSTGSS